LVLEWIAHFAPQLPIGLGRVEVNDEAHRAAGFPQPEVRLADLVIRGGEDAIARQAGACLAVHQPE
jgi:hypothetical protein